MNGLSRTLDPRFWGSLPFHFWSVLLFTLGCMIGSFLNVCIHRMPRGMSVVRPASHCPHCRYSIPWYLNMPLFTWVILRGRCANFIVATFIDFEHYIIPDEITIGGMVAGVVLSFAVPALHGAAKPAESMIQSLIGLAVGAGVLYAVVRIGKILFGRQHIDLPLDTRIIFTETGVVLPDQEIPFEELFYRKSDVITLEAKSVELIDRCYPAVTIRLQPEKLFIGEEELNPESVLQMEVVADKITLPREAMGFGDVKFMGAIGAFLGWQATLFSLMVSSIIGAFVGLVLIALRRQEWSSKLPYGPYIALAAVIWMFSGQRLMDWWFPH
jgi:leader peptidase (prepilin peptidase)/N-methyltransferase